MSDIDSLITLRKEVSDAIDDLLRNDLLIENYKWLSPSDRDLPVLNLSNLSDEFKNIDSLSALVSKSFEIIPYLYKTKFRRCLLELEPLLETLSSGSSLPSNDFVHNSMMSNDIYFSVCSLDGYSFSAEFDQFYRGRSNIANIYENTNALIQRALQATESTIENKIAIQLSSFILLLSCRDMLMAKSTCENTLIANFKFLPVNFEKTQEIKAGYIFIGKDYHRRTCVYTKFSPMSNCSSDNSESSKLQFRYNSYYYLSDIENAFKNIENDKENIPTKTVSISLLNTLVVEEIDQETYAGDTNITFLSADIDLLTQLPEASICAELWGWGADSYHTLGLGDSEHLKRDRGYFPGPRPIPIPAALSIQRIRQIVCTSHHTLILTDQSVILSCGDNSDGILGLGDTKPRTQFTPILWSLDSHNVTKIAAGFSHIGGHSMAMDSSGNIYGWGTSILVGTGEKKAVLSPVKIPILINNENDENAPINGQVIDMDCGSGFTVVILSIGRIASWGMWSHGRLGLGPPPTVVTQRTGSFLKNSKKVLRFQTRPSVLVPLQSDGVTAAAKPVRVCCGEAHSLALFSDGSIWSWGQNNSGQLGTGLTDTGFLVDAFTPLPVYPFVFTSKPTAPLMSVNYNEKMKSWNTQRAVFISCGGHHSIAKSEDGRVWSWGGRGGTQLGHADVSVSGPWSERLSGIFSAPTDNSSGRVLVPYELCPWVKRWSVPRPIEAVTGRGIRQVVCGSRMTAFLCEDGRVMFSGSDPCIPVFLSQLSKTNDPKELLEESSDVNDNVANDNQAKNRVTFSTAPRSPSVYWLAPLSSRKVLLVATAKDDGTDPTRRQSQSKQRPGRVFVLLDEEMIAQSVTGRLHRKAERLSESTLGEDLIADNESTASVGSLSSSGLGVSTLRRGGIDCTILAGGRQFLAHRAILSERCHVLRDMLLVEDPTGKESVDRIIQLLLPELRADTALYLLYFLYRDTLPNEVQDNSSLLRSLLTAAKSLRLTRLQVICQRLLEVRESLLGVSGSGIDPTESAAASTTNMHGLELPPPTLSRDMGALLGDSMFSDVRFITTENRGLSAHRHILESRCEYFRAMFRFRKESNKVKRSLQDLTFPSEVDIIVPDSFIGMLRLLVFLYSDIIPEGSDETLLQDLLSADRYGISDMKFLCESMLMPTTENWSMLLDIAERTDSHRLLVEIRSFLVFHLKDLVANGINIQSFSKEYSSNIIHQVMEEMLICHPLPPSPLLQSLVFKINHVENEAEKAVPWVELIGAISVAVIYQMLMNVIAFGPLIPVINIIGISGVIFVFYRRMRG